MPEQFEHEFMDKEEQAINSGLHKQMESSNIDYYNSLTPEIIEDFMKELIDSVEKGEPTWDDIKDQLNEDKPINELN